MHRLAPLVPLLIALLTACAGAGVGNPAPGGGAATPIVAVELSSGARATIAAAVATESGRAPTQTTITTTEAGQAGAGESPTALATTTAVAPEPTTPPPPTSTAAPAPTERAPGPAQPTPPAPSAATPTLPPPTESPAASATPTTPPLPTATLLGASPTVASGAAAISPELLAQHLATLNPAADYAVDWERLPLYTLDVQLEPPAIGGQLTLNYLNVTGVPLDRLVLRLFPNGRPIYGGSLTVGAVRVGETPAAHAQRDGNTVLEITLPAPLPPEGRTEVTIDFETTVGGARAGYGILNQMGGVTTLGSWFPILATHNGESWETPAIPLVGDAVTSESALFRVTLVAPSGLEIASTGQVLMRESGGSTTTWTLLSGPARDFALAASGEWAPLEQVVDGVTVRYLPAPGTSNAAVPAQQALATTAEALRVFNARFGPYPYREFEVVEASVPIGGYEYPGLILFDGAQRVSGDVESVTFLLAHELAHQWFYGLVGNDVTAEPWLDESLATFATLFVGGDGAGRRARWEAEYARDLARRPVGVGQSVFRFDNWRTYRGPVYYAGAIMMDDLRRQLGDETFFNAMRAYVRAFAFRRASAAALRATLEQTSRRDLSAFWQTWVSP